MESPLHLSRADTLRAMAHPMRIEILGSLRVDGPATSARLARRLGTDSGQTSHHLRHLARYGFVVEAPDLGKGPRGRERWWRAGSRSTTWDPGADDATPGYAEAARAMGEAADEVWNRAIERYRAEAARLEWSAAWRKAATSGDFILRTTPAGLSGLWSDVAKAVEERAAEPEPEAENVVVIMHAFPRRAGE
ncbi:helix-turn-helix domain-containing protein [Winogradskya consettensis]|uniref:Transcriptional regulator n=1 Tax=Winogradskya consettensis TaxID=113560 RepID=A0A919SKM9_9ACTN|nr:helix-turn-helix domain-containing protein [Actinoplanes consettensis]GIM73294.1 transcriptional regulator [Actinoplanes consettensis]